MLYISIPLVLFLRIKGFHLISSIKKNGKIYSITQDAQEAELAMSDQRQILLKEVAKQKTCDGLHLI